MYVRTKLINSKNTNLFVDLTILKYILILSLDLQQASLNIYIYAYIYIHIIVTVFVNGLGDQGSILC